MLPASKALEIVMLMDILKMTLGRKYGRGHKAMRANRQLLWF